MLFLQLPPVHSSSTARPPDRDIRSRSSRNLLNENPSIADAFGKKVKNKCIYIYKYKYIPLNSKRELPDPTSCKAVQAKGEETSTRPSLPNNQVPSSSRQTLQSCTGQRAARSKVQCLAIRADRSHLYVDRHEQRWLQTALEVFQAPLSDLPPRVVNGPERVDSWRRNLGKLPSCSKRNVVGFKLHWPR